MGFPIYSRPDVKLSRPSRQYSSFLKWTLGGLGALVWIVLGVGCNGCATMSYLGQSALGQFEISNRARSIQEVLNDEKTPPTLKKLLKEVPAIKSFAEANGIKATKNYQDYVDIKRSAASYVVSASEKLKFKSKEWSFPIVGKFPYLGWFDLSDAKVYAEKLRIEGWDVDLRGAGAFSTLGWLKDPILSTMIPEGPSAIGELVDVVIHESVHATIYLDSQAPFNESLAMFVARGLTEIYLSEKFGGDSAELKAYIDDELASAKRTNALHKAYLELNALYESSVSDAEKLTIKAQKFKELSLKLGAKRELTNASLVQFKTYYSGQDQFKRVFASTGSNYKDFLNCVLKIRPLWFSSSQQENFSSVLAELEKVCS